MPTSNISFREIPRTSGLFADFLYDFERVAAFFSSEAKNGKLIERARRVTAQEFSRNEVADVLRDQNSATGAGEATFANIELLRDKDSVVVITGQQSGLFTGPLFTIYKALTVIKLAARLRQEGLKVVPMFWIASEDHDFAEINHCQIVNREGQLQKIAYTACEPREGKPVGRVELCAEINEQIAQISAALPESEFVSKIEKDLQSAYKSGINFAAAFARLVTSLFAQYGVVTIDPLDERLKRVARNIYGSAITHIDEFTSSLLDASDALVKAGYHAQVHITRESVPLFYLNDGRRTALQREPDGSFLVKGTQTRFSASELLERIEHCPACFSPNVTLRPIVQDYLVPALAYIGGPAELAYFAQIRPGYKTLGRLEPVIVPRASMTLVEKRVAKTLEKHQLEFTDLFQGHDAVLEKVFSKNLYDSTDGIFEESEKIIGDQLDKLVTSLSAVEPTLADALKGGRDKVRYQLTNLRTRFIHNRAKHDETTNQQIDRVFTVLYPNKNLQEREINVTYFLTRYGYGLIDRLLQEIDLDSPDHKLIKL
jgi:bacillithiol synthase